MPDEAPATSRGRIGAEIYDQVEQMLANENITRTEAFNRLSEQTGRRPGTRAANYYRVARQRGAHLAPRRRRTAGARRGRRGRGAADVQGALRRAQAALDELTAVVRAQEQEVTRLRSENESYAEIKRLMKRVK
jgi:hypothetical protein